MKLETVRDRINNAKAKIERKTGTIEKKTKLIAKKEEKLYSLGFTKEAKWDAAKADSKDAYWLICDIENLQDDITRLQKEIEETKKSLEKYEGQLTGAVERERILLKEIPDSMKRMQQELVDRWDVWDIERRNQMLLDYRTLGYRDFMKKYRGQDTEFRWKTDEQIHSANMEDAKALILDLYYRVRSITGEITDWNGIHCESGNLGCVLNGFVIGKEGRCEIESIYAGGYNIQRLHIRVLVHAR